MEEDTLNISPDVIMWSFGLIIASITGIIGVIVGLVIVVWKQQGVRFQKLEDDAMWDRTEAISTAKRIFDVLEVIKNSVQHSKDSVLEKFVSKEYCRERHDSVGADS